MPTRALLALLTLSFPLAAQPAAAPPIKGIQDLQIFRLWTNDAPGALGSAPTDIPTITAYLPRNTPPGMTALLIFPGGGYQNLADNHEGRQVANFLNSAGVAAFVVKYRLGPRYHHPIEWGDAQRAIRMVRAHAADWHIAQDRIGVLGFSAGGHLAATASTHFDTGNPAAKDPLDQPSSRPDFSILAYPVISMTENWTHQGSKKNLLGDNPSPELAKDLSLDQSVTAQTPPTFIFQTNADKTVPAENSVYYYLALRKAGVPAEMHIFENGPHGVGLATDDPALGQWQSLLIHWLQGRGLVKK